MREAVGRSPDIALTLLLLKLVTDTFRTSGASGSCVEVSVFIARGYQRRSWFFDQLSAAISFSIGFISGGSFQVRVFSIIGLCRGQ